MPMRSDDFRRIALGLQGAIESAHMNHPDFRVNGKIFATLTEDGSRGMVALTPEQQAAFMRDHPGMFEPASGAWGRQGSTMVKLAAADAEAVGEAMTLAWQKRAMAPAKTTKAKTKPKAKRAPSAVQKRRRHRQ